MKKIEKLLITTSILGTAYLFIMFCVMMALAAVYFVKNIINEGVLFTIVSQIFLGFGIVCSVETNKIIKEYKNEEK